MLLAAGTPPALSPLVPFLALVPLAVHLARLPAGARGGADALAAGVLTGAVQHGWGLRWLPGTFAAVAGPLVGLAGSAAALAALAAITGAAAWACHRLLVGPASVSLGFALPLAWTALEWILAHLPLGLAFPWAPLGLGLTRWPELLGIAELVGVGGVTAWLAAVNGLLAAAVLRAAPGGGAHPGGSRWSTAVLAPAAVALLLALLPVAWGGWRAGRLDTSPTGTVAALALELPTGGPAPARAAATPDAAARALAAVEPGGLHLVVLPEMALPLAPDSPGGTAAVGRLRALAVRAGAPLLTGALRRGSEGVFNSVLLVSAEQSPDHPGAFVADKRRLVPGVERGSAVRAPWLAPAGSGGYAPGASWPVAAVGPLRGGVLVCYEVAFAGDVRRLILSGANLLIALTSDAWFAGGAGGRRAGIAQQLAHLSMRAVETRTGAVRASSGGPAALVGPDGAIEPEAAPGAASGVVRAATRPTLFVRTGDLAGPLSTFLVLLALAGGAHGRHPPVRGG